MAFTCTTNGGGVELSASTFENIYGKYADWASYKTGVPYVMILIMWFHESGKGKKNINTPYNNPANAYGSGPNHPYANICLGVTDFINLMTGTNFNVNAIDANGRSASKYIKDAIANGYTIPASNLYGAIPGAGTYYAPGFGAGCAALGAMGWAESYYYNSGSAVGSIPNAAGNILQRWWELFYPSISKTKIGTTLAPSCCS